MTAITHTETRETPRCRAGFFGAFLCVLTLAALSGTEAGAVGRGALESAVAQYLRVEQLPVVAPTNGQALAYDSSTKRAVWTTITTSGDIEGVTAGAGLTGGGTSGTVSVAVGAGTGITVNADDVALDLAGATIAYTGSFAVTGNGTRVFEGWKRRVYTYLGGSGAATTLTHSQSGSIICNTGATEETYVNLPTLDGAEDVGLVYTFDCSAASAGSYGLRFVAASGDTITVGTDTSASAGYVRTTIVNSCVTIYAASTSEWRAINGSLGPWEVN